MHFMLQQYNCLSGSAGIEKKLGKQVPTEIGVVTFDNYPFAEYMDPPLTVVDIDTYKLGEMAAEVLINKIKDQNFIQRENPDFN